MLAGRCWTHVLATMPGFAAIPESSIALIGARDLDPLEERALANSAIADVPVGSIRKLGVRAAFEPVLERLAHVVDRVYLHVDLDVLDPAGHAVNRYDVPGGLGLDEVLDAIALIGRHIPLAGGGLASYDPSVDPKGQTAEAAIAVLQAMIAARRTARVPATR